MAAFIEGWPTKSLMFWERRSPDRPFFVQEKTKRTEKSSRAGFDEAAQDAVFSVTSAMAAFIEGWPTKKHMFLGTPIS